MFMRPEACRGKGGGRWGRGRAGEARAHRLSES